MKIKDKINEKLNEKKLYCVCMSSEALFNVAVITALNLLSKDNRAISCVEGDYAVLFLNMDARQKAAIELALADYLVAFELDESDEDLRAAVWK